MNRFVQTRNACEVIGLARKAAGPYDSATYIEVLMTLIMDWHEELAKALAAAPVEQPPLAVGCIYDGARGVYQGEAIQELAIQYGWPAKNYCDSEHDSYHEAIIEAEAYLQDFALPYTTVGNNESGDFGCWPNLEDQEDIPVFEIGAPALFTGDAIAYTENSHSCGYWRNGEMLITYWEI